MSAAFTRVAVIGTGLIGGSLACALRRSQTVGEIVGCAQSERTARRALELGVVDRMEKTPAAAAAGAQLIVIATPVGISGEMFGALAQAPLDDDVVITDVGSVKQPVIEQARSTLGGHFANFVPGHPIAGTERSGIEAAFAALFDHHRVVLTPLPQTHPQAIAQVHSLWEAVGAHVVEMAAAEHDRIFAETSHLPHLLAYALVDCLAAMADGPAIFEYAAGGFFDFTRIASSDPVMWRDICHANRKPLAASLARLQEQLAAAQEAITRGDADWLEDMFRRAKTARDTLLPADARAQSTE